MKRPRLRRRWLVPLGILLLPPLFWMLVLAIAPTDWARTRVIAKLAAATGRAVELESLQVGTLGGVWLNDLEIGAPGSAHDPWLKVAQVRINVSLFQLVFGQMEPTEIDLTDLYVRVLRRSDGTLELADLIPRPSSQHVAVSTVESDSTDGSSCRCARMGLELRLHDAQVQIIDEPSRTRLDFQQIEGRATWHGHRATIHELRGTLNDGPVELAAHFDCSTHPPTYEGEVRARDVALSEGMNALAYLVPVVAGTEASARLEGRINLGLFLNGQGLRRADVRRTLAGHGKVTLDPVRLDGSKLLAELGTLVPLPGQGRVGSVKGDFAIKDGRIATDDLTVNLGKLPIFLSGSTDFDGRLNYRLKTDRLVERLPGKARDLLSELSIDLNQAADVRVAGTIDSLAVMVSGVPVGAPAAGAVRADRPRADRERIRDISRKLRDQLLR